MHPQNQLAQWSVCLHESKAQNISYSERRSYITYFMCRDRKHTDAKVAEDERRKAKIQKKMVVTEYECKQNRTNIYQLGSSDVVVTVVVVAFAQFHVTLASGLATTNCHCYCCRQRLFVGCRHC